MITEPGIILRAKSTCQPIDLPSGLDHGASVALKLADLTGLSPRFPFALSELESVPALTRPEEFYLFPALGADDFPSDVCHCLSS